MSGLVPKPSKWVPKSPRWAVIEAVAELLQQIWPHTVLQLFLTNKHSWIIGVKTPYADVQVSIGDEASILHVIQLKEEGGVVLSPHRELRREVFRNTDTTDFLGWLCEIKELVDNLP